MKIDDKTALEKVLQNCRESFLYVGFFSLFINLLMLTGPLFMLQVYDRVLASRSTDTLLLLSLVIVAALLSGYLATSIPITLVIDGQQHRLRTQQDTVGALLIDACQNTFGEAARQPAGTMLDPLTPREREVARLICQGHSNAEIARQLVVAVSTIKKHASHIYDKLGVRSRTQAIARAHELGLV